MTKAVLNLVLTDDKTKKKAMGVVCGLSGVNSIAMDMEDKKMTVIGDMDPVDVVNKLRKKVCNTNMIWTGPEIEQPKKPEEKKKSSFVAQKVVLNLNLNDDKTKIKAMVSVCGLSGVNSISMDMKDKKMTVTGDMDPYYVVNKLRKVCNTDILSFGPEKEEPKKPEVKKKDDVVTVLNCPSYNPYNAPQYYQFIAPEFYRGM